MKTKSQIPCLTVALAWLAGQPATAATFGGRIVAELTRGGEVTPFLYTFGTNCLRVSVAATDRPYPVNLLDLQSGERTLLFPNNRSFVRLKSQAENSFATPRGFPPMPAMPPGSGRQTQTLSAPSTPAHTGPVDPTGAPVMPQIPSPHVGFPPGVGPQAGNNPSIPQMPPASGVPGMPMMPPMTMEKIELAPTGDKTNLLGYGCTRFELRQRGEVMEIWATDNLLPFQPYLQHQPHRFGPRMIEEQWGDLLKAKKLFPLLAILRFEAPAAPGQPASSAGPERLRFEVKTIARESIPDQALFQPPPDYHELDPLPF